MALTTGEVGFVYGTVGVIMLTLGGIIGGFVVARDGLERWLWPMALAIHLPNLAFLFLAYAQPESLWVITAAVAIEQFGYGFGFTAYLLYCVYVATRQTRNGALRAVHRLHGAGHDDSRHVERLAAGADRLPALFRVDHAGDDSQLAGRGVHSGRSRIWQENGDEAG